MGSTATIEGRGCRTFQYGHRLDIIRVDGRDAITEVITSTFAGTAKVCIIQRHTIHHVKRLVIACHFCITTKEHAGRTRSTASGVLHNETSHLTRKRVDDVGFLRLGEFLTLHFLQAIAQGLAVSLDTKGGDNYLIQDLTILLHLYFHAISSFHGHRLVTDVAHFERYSRLAIQRKVTIQIGNGTVGCTGHLHASSNQGFASGIHHCTLDALVLLNAHRSIVHLGSKDGRSRHPHQTCTEHAEKHGFLSHNRYFVFSLTLFFPKDSFENPRSIHLHTLETVEDAILLRAVAEVVVVPNESREASFASLRSQELTVVGHVFMDFL